MSSILPLKRYLIYSFLFCAFLLTSFIALDPDFGWHIRFGQLVLTTHQVPKQDPFSYSMPSYHFINHEWLLDVLQSLLYPLTGRFGLALLFTLGMVLSIYLVERLARQKIPFFFFITGIISLFTIGGLRDQIFSWLFFSVLLHFLLNSRLQRYTYLLPFFFLAWANIHGGFLLGLLFLWIFFLSRCYEKKRFDLRNAGIIVLSTIITLLNPYGAELWLEVVRSSPHIAFSSGISEWLPIISIFNITNSIFLVICTGLFLSVRKSLKLSESIPFLLLLLLGSLHIRHLPFFILYSFFLVPNMLQQFKKRIAPIPLAANRFSIAIKYLSVGVIFLATTQFLFLLPVPFKLNENSYYPTGAATFLSRYPVKKVFSTYPWGGYLLWKLPQAKVFIDGRMPHWKQEGKENESQNANQETEDLLRGKETLSFFLNKYNVDTFVLPVTPSPNSQTNSLFRRLISIGWTEIYKDSIAVVLQHRGKNLK